MNHEYMFLLKGVKKRTYTATKMTITHSIFTVHTCYTYHLKRNIIRFSDHTSKF